MRGQEHAAIAGGTAFLACLGLQQAGMDIQPVSMVAAAFAAGAGGLAPDLDHPWSLASFAIPTALVGYGGVFLLITEWQKRQPGPHLIDFSALGPGFVSSAWLGVWIGVFLLALSLTAAKLFGHRGPVHSILFGVIATIVVALGLLVFGGPVWWSLAFAWGWATHLAADATTKMGLPSLMWPLGAKPAMETPSAIAVAAIPGTPVPASTFASTTETQTPLCPHCGIPMVLRMAKHGEKQGQQFYGCANFPQCRQTRQLDASRARA